MASPFAITLSPSAVRNQIPHPVLDAPDDQLNPDQKKSNHRVNVVRIGEIVAHPDPETTSLALIYIGGYQLVVRKGQFTPGDLAVFIQPDSVVPQTTPFKFIWESYVGIDGLVPEKRRRVTVRKFRKEYSEGLLLPITDFSEDSLTDRYGNTLQAGIRDIRTGQLVAVKEGDDVSDILGVTHYDPDAATSDTKADQGKGPKRKFRYPKTLSGWLHLIWYYVTGRGREKTRDVPFTIPTYDVEAYKNYKGTFTEDDIVVITEKVHGSNGRFIFLDGEMYAGSRNQWKARGGNDVWNKALAENPWIEEWCRQHEGYQLYGEVTPTQKGGGKTFDYGRETVQFFLFDIRTPDGLWVDFDDYSREDLDLDAFNYYMVPVLYYGPFVFDKVLELVDGDTVTGGKHLREGVVIKTSRERQVRGLGRAQLKIVSNKFLEKDSK